MMLSPANQEQEFRVNDGKQLLEVTGILLMLEAPVHYG